MQHLSDTILNMSTTQTLKEQQPAAQQVVAGGDTAGASGNALRQNLWLRFGPGVVAVILTAGLSVFGWLMANQIADTERDINRVETQLIRVETNLREDMANLETRLSADIARVESKLDSLIASLITDQTAAVNR